MERRAAWIAPPMLALAGLAQLSGLSPGGPPGAAAAGRDLDWSDPRPIAMCPQPLAVASEETQSGAGIAWRVRPVLGADGALAGWDLVTAADGSPAHTLRLPPESAVRGPVGGLLAVASDDGRSSEISLVSPREGCREVRLVENHVVRQAVLDPGTGAVVYHAVSRSDRSDAGTWRLADETLASGASARQLLAPLAGGSPIRAEVGEIWTTDLVYATTGGTLAIQSCGRWACRTRLVGAEAGSSTTSEGSDEGPIVGLDDSTLITFGRCTGSPCPLIATAIGSGRSLVLSSAATSATTFSIAGRLAVAAIVLEDPRPRLIAVDPVSGRRQPLAAVDPWLELLRAGGSAAGGVETRAGILPAEDGVTGRPVLLDPGPIQLGPGSGAGTPGTPASPAGNVPEVAR